MAIDWSVSTFTGSYALSNIASVATIVLFCLGLISYRTNSKRLEKERKHQVTEERKMASTNIYLELEYALDGLNRSKHPGEALSFKIKDGQNTFFMNRKFNHDFYDSLVFSGKIGFLKPGLQQKIQDIFGHIKRHNEVLRIIAGMKDELGDLISPRAYEYYIWLDGCEQKMMKTIPKIQEELKKDFEVSLPW